MLTSACIGLAWLFGVLAVLRVFRLLLNSVRQSGAEMSEAVLVAVYAGVSAFFWELSWFVCPL